MENKISFENHEPLNRVIDDEASLGWVEGEFNINLALNDQERNFFHREIVVQPENLNLLLRFTDSDTYTAIKISFHEDELSQDQADELRALIGDKYFNMCLALSKDLHEDDRTEFYLENIELKTKDHLKQIQRWLNLREQTVRDK